MREIKFRAWDKEDRLMNSYNHLTDLTLGYVLEAKRHALMQYTGLKDKNGAEIYEGDILRLKNAKGQIANYQEVYWHEEAASFDWRPTNDDSWPDGFTGFHDDYEVIGNIYENPELVK